MSYVAVGAASLGTLDPWSCMSCHVWSSSDVYVLRLVLGGLSVKTPADALLFVAAAGQDQNLELDIRGVAVTADDAGKVATVDVVGTIVNSGLQLPLLADDAADMGKNIAADPDLRAAFPGFSVVSSTFGRLTAPADAIDHWRAQPILWDHALSGPRSRGGPTDTFAKPAEYSIVKGTADDGSRASPWPFMTHGLGHRPNGGSTVLLAIGLIALGAVGMKILKEKRR